MISVSLAALSEGAGSDGFEELLLRLPDPAQPPDGLGEVAMDDLDLELVTLPLEPTGFLSAAGAGAGNSTGNAGAPVSGMSSRSNFGGE